MSEKDPTHRSQRVILQNLTLLLLQQRASTRNIAAHLCHPKLASSQPTIQVSVPRKLIRSRNPIGLHLPLSPHSGEGEAAGHAAIHKRINTIIELVTIIVDEYDSAIAFFVGTLGFELVEDSPSLTNDGRPKRWVVVRPPHAMTGILLAQADGDTQSRAVGNQTAGRVGFFLRTDDFAKMHTEMLAAGVRFVTEPRTESYGRVAVFTDIAGNRWDLLGP